MKLDHALFAGIGAAALSCLGCAHAKPPPDAEVHVHQVPAAAKPAPAVAQAPAPQDTDYEAMLRGDVLHFGFGIAELTDDDRGRLQHVSDLMRAHGELRIRIDGNTDERGTEEYNLELGQRRAEVAKKYLTALGVDGSRVSTLSHGKDNPVAGTHDEASWAQNRRDDIAVKRD
ncbi:MAG: OmpA family protein [Deltaproteobacteria bacterium]|nr:OmpA family protein [Deltaproteobacteria bacterium]